MHRPTAEQMRRDLAADLREHHDMAREVGIGLAFGPPDGSGVYEHGVYEYAGFALEALPAAAVRAQAAEEVCRRLAALARGCGSLPSDFLALADEARQLLEGE